MKKIISIVVMAMMFVAGVQAQSAIDMNRQQNELNGILRKTLNAKPTKEAKKEAKQLMKQGWSVPAGERSIEQQITESLLLGAEVMADENGAPTRRFIQHTAVTVAGTYNAAYATGRANAQAEIANMLATEIAAAMKGKLDNAQQNTITATSVDKYNQRIRSIVHESLTNSIPVLSMYRTLPNNNVEVQVRIAFDKKEVTARIKRNLQKELEVDGDELDGMIGGAMNNTL